VSYIDQSVFQELERRLLRNRKAREKRGALPQDFECLTGEVFFGNLKPVEFETLPLKCKRKGGPARITRVISEIRNSHNVVFVPTYEKLYGDKESIAVYVYTYELDILGIKY